MPDPNQGGLFDRLGNLVELITTLDVRVTNALEGLEEMRASITGFDPAREDIERLVGDIQARVAKWDERLERDIDDVRARIERWDERLERDLDDVKALVMKKINSLDIGDIDGRFERLERALLNVEKATVNLDHTLAATIEALPDFVTRRVKRDVRKKNASIGPEGLDPDDIGL